MNIKITKPISGGTVAAVPSKSMAHRLLICAALSSEESSIHCPQTSADIDATVRCLTGLGARIGYDNGVFRVSPVPRPVPGGKTLDAGESGATLRFMLPVACALGAGAAFKMSGHLPSRPLSPLFEELAAHGCTLSARGSNPLQTGGRLAGGVFTIPGDISSQFISGLLFALPLLPGESVINVTGALESRPYIDMTLSALRASGITVRQDGPRFLIPGAQRYMSRGAAAVEGDWSNAAFWLCMGALGAEAVTVTNLNTDSLQGDKRVLDILERFGAGVQYGGGRVTVARGPLRGIDIDAADTPDLVPVLAVVASVSDGRTVIRNAGRLRIKESDRLKTVTASLSSLGADIEETRDGLNINGRKRLYGGTVVATNDHRLTMLAALAAAVCDHPVTITDADAVNKSYPGFFSDYTALGGCIEEVS